MLSPGRRQLKRLLALVLLAGNGLLEVRAQDGIPRPAIRDSAGVRIVEYPTLGPTPPPWAFTEPNPFALQLHRLPAAFRVDPKPYLDLGGLNEREEEELDGNPFISATELDDGTIVVNNMSRLLFFSGAGKFLRTVGRRGAGPGEFGQVQYVCRLAGDRLLAVDYIGGRLTLWDAHGNHVRTFARPGEMPGKACNSDGSVIVRDPVTGPIANVAGDRLAPHRLVHMDGSVVQQLGMLPAIQSWGGVQLTPSVTLFHNELYVGIPRTYEVRVQSLAGQVRRITRLSRPLVPITDKEWRARAEASVPTYYSAAVRAKAIAEEIARKPPAAYPAYSSVRIDPLGRVWVADFESERNWTVFDSTGMVMGRLELPGDMRSRVALAGIEATHIVVRELDSEGAVHLRFHRIVPNQSPQK